MWWLLFCQQHVESWSRQQISWVDLFVDKSVFGCLASVPAMLAKQVLIRTCTLVTLCVMEKQRNDWISVKIDGGSMWGLCSPTAQLSLICTLF